MSRLFLLALAYFAAGWLGLKIPSIGTHITLVWLPAGIAVAALLRWGWTLWPAIFIGAFLVNGVIGPSWLLAAGLAVGNTLGPLLAVELLKRSGFHSVFDRRRDVGLLIGAASIGMTVSALGGVVNLYVAGLLPSASIGFAWLTWWLGDTVGVLLAAPFVLTLTRETRRQLNHSRTDFLLWICFTVPVMWFAFVYVHASTGHGLPVAFLTLPLIVWSALRFGSAGAALAAMLFSGVAAWSTASGHGPFIVADANASLFLLWSYMATAAITALLISAMQAENSSAERELRESDQRIRLATETTGVGIWEWNVITNKVRWDAQMFRMYGVPPSKDGFVEYGTWSACVVPEDLPGQEEIMQDTIRRKSKSARQFRIRRTNDGENRVIQAMEVVRTNERGQVEWMIGTDLDITERKLGERALLRFRMAMETSLDGIFVMDFKTLRYLDVNETGCRMTGYSREELLTMSVLDLNPGMTDAAQRSRFEQARALGSDQMMIETEGRSMRHRDGRTFPIEVARRYVCIDGHEIIVGASRDATLRKQAEMATRQALQRLTDAQQVGNIGDWEWNTTGRSITWSAQMFTIFGRNPGLGSSLSYEEHAALFDAESAAVLDEMAARATRSGETQSGELRVQRPDGEWVDLQVTTLPKRDASGNVSGLFGTVQDISARKRAERFQHESEQRLGFALDSALIGEWDMDLRTNVVRRSLLHDQCFGYSEAVPEWGYDTFLAHVHSDDRNRVDDCYKRAMAGEGAYDVEFRVQWPDGSLHWLWSKGCFYFDAAGQPYRVAGIQVDITARRQAEESIRQLNIELEQRVAQRTAELNVRNKDLAVFNYSVSHDLKAPLRGIDGYSSLLMQNHESRLDDEGRAFLRNIRSATAQMQQMINDMLAYAKIEQASLLVRRAALLALVEEVLKAGAYDLSQVQIDIDVHAGLVRMDRDNLSKILRNLIDNAVKFSRNSKPPVVEIRSWIEGDRHILCVRDNGIGFDMKYHDRIFEIFQRLQRAEDFSGTGVGLAIVQKAAERMGCRVWAQSEPGKGATFYLDMPSCDGAGPDAT